MKAKREKRTIVFCRNRGFKRNYVITILANGKLKNEVKRVEIEVPV